MTQQCKVCNETKQITKFAKTGSGKHRNKICRSCQHKKQKKNPRYLMSRMLSMAKLRCTDPNNDSYSRYGGRGIKFLINREKFYNKFFKKVEFIIQAGQVPSIDRVNVNGHYEMDNVQVVPLKSNTAEMRARAKQSFKDKRILAEQAPTKKCNSCHQDFPTKSYYVNKRHKDGTISRYNTCSSCEKIKRKERYGSKSYYKGRT